MKPCLQHATYSYASLCAAALECPALQGEKLGLCLKRQSFNRICDLFTLGTCIEKVQASSCSSWVRDADCLASIPCKTWKNAIFFFKFSISCLHVANLSRQFYKILIFFLLTVYTLSRNLSLVLKAHSLKFQTVMWFSVWKFMSNVVHLYKVSQSASRIFLKLFSHAWSIMKLFPECFY